VVAADDVGDAIGLADDGLVEVGVLAVAVVLVRTFVA
jgi:hypothetical protein